MKIPVAFSNRRWNYLSIIIITNDIYKGKYILSIIPQKVLILTENINCQIVTGSI